MDLNELQKLITGEMKEIDKALRELFPLDDRVEDEWNIIKQSFAKWDEELQKGNKPQLIPSDIKPVMDNLIHIKTAVGPKLAEDARQKLKMVQNFVKALYESIMAEHDQSNGGSDANVSYTGSGWADPPPSKINQNNSCYDILRFQDPRNLNRKTWEDNF